MFSIKLVVRFSPHRSGFFRVRNNFSCSADHCKMFGFL